MNRTMKKAFTLVEMLIVVIIIGILIAALFPKLKWAQGAARDTARQVALGNIGTALFQYQSEEWVYPDGTCTVDIKNDLSRYLSSMPSDPQSKRVAYGTKANGCTSGSFAYAPLYNAWAQNGWYVLAANTESEGRKSNFVLPHLNEFFTGSDNTAVSNIWWWPQNNMSDFSWFDSAKLNIGPSSDNTAAKIYDSRVIPVLSCKQWVETVGDPAQQTMCKTDLVDKWKTTAANNMVYVVSQ